MKQAALLFTVVMLFGMSGLYINDYLTTSEGTKLKIKAGLAALFYGTFALVILYGLLFADG